jgi:hypothetical protein
MTELGEQTVRTGRVVGVGLLAFLAVIGFDLLLHGGLLSPLYKTETPFLLSPIEAFRRIPLGYASFAILVLLLEWLMIRFRIVGARAGLLFGLKLGGLVWSSLALGLLSISTARPTLLLGWAIGQAAELGVAGAVIGKGIQTGGIRRLVISVVVVFVACVVIGVVLQNLLV